MRAGTWREVAPYLLGCVVLLGGELGCGRESSPGSTAGGAAGAGAGSGGSAQAGTPGSGGAAARGGAAGNSASSGSGGTGDTGGVGGAGGAGGKGESGGAGAAGQGGTSQGGEGSGTGGAGGEGGAACVPRLTGQKPADLFLLVDQTRFLGDPLQVGSGTYFGATVDALGRFVSAPAASGTGVAVGYFPLEGTPDACAASYESPEVEVSEVPAAAAALQASFAAHAPNDEASAIAPALGAAILHLRAWGTAHPERRPVVVLLASFAEVACTTWDELYAVARAGFAATPSVETAVISLLADSTRSLLLATESMSTPFIIDSQGDVSEQVEAALLGLTNPASSCQLDYPRFEPHLEFDDTQVSMLYTPNATGVAVELPRVASAAACLGEPGWYLTEDLPRMLVACPASCATFTAGYLSARVDCP